MGKVSSNAGKHPYLRSDFEYRDMLYDKLINKENGFKIDFNVKPYFNNPIYCDLKDINNNKLFYGNHVLYNNEKYEIDYDAKEFFWFIKKLTNNNEILKLLDVIDSLILI